MNDDPQKVREPGAIAERIGLAFTDPALLARAFTHPSWTSEHGGEHYQRLEFLGDAVIGFLIAEMLHEMYPDATEGDLTHMRISLVRGRSLAKTARDLGLPDGLRLGRGAERDGNRQRTSVHEALYESLVGAVYLDGGIDAARRFVESTLGAGAREAYEHVEQDAKSRLQERLQGAGASAPVYVTAPEGEAPTQPWFASEVRAADEVLGAGSGRSKQVAEQAAAADALRRLGEAR